MRTIVIEWQRLLDEQKRTCPRCSSTEQEVEKAVEELGHILATSGIAVTLTKKVVDAENFKKDALQSNKILIAGRSLEEWLGARTGQSKCCATCGDAECRTVVYAGDTHEAIPAGLIVRAGLTAAASLFNLKPLQLDRQIPLLKMRPR